MQEIQIQIDELMKILATKLIQQSKKVTTVESCTGGGISSALTSVSGSSAFIEQAFVTYSNSAKMRLVGVEAHVLEEYGAVSELVVQQMAKGGQTKAQSDYAIAVSGVAGPTGGSVEKPVGTVWIALATPKQLISNVYQFSGDREKIRLQSILQALKTLYEDVCKSEKGNL